MMCLEVKMNKNAKLIYSFENYDSICDLDPQTNNKTS
jgi:hypothetical protein